MHLALLAPLLWQMTAAELSNAPAVHMLVPGFKVQELPLELSNQNNLRFAPDGTLTSLGYDGRIWRLRDTNGDGLEDTAEPLWSRPTLSVPLGMAWSTHGLFVASKGKISLLTDTNSDGVFDAEKVIASGWPPTDVGSGGVDATAVTLDKNGDLYFGLLVADYSNAYRIRRRRDLKPAEISWLKENGRWREPSGEHAEDDEFSLYDIHSRRGTIQKWDHTAGLLSTVATGIRVPVALAFNSAGDLFNTDQEGETWMPNGNPLDELNQIVPGRNYGFPPAHPRWLPGLVSQPPVVAFAPQHQSSCGLIFNDPHPASLLKASGTALPVSPAQALFGPEEWRHDAFVAGESRGRIWRVHLAKTPKGYVGRAQTIARLDMLTVDLAISPAGALYVACHSGPPDWGTGPRGPGKIFKITRADAAAPIPLEASPVNSDSVEVRFNLPLDSSSIEAIASGASIEFGDYVSAGDRYEKLKPPYAVVQQQDAASRGHLAVRKAELKDGGRVLVLTTDPHLFATRYAITLPAIKAPGADGAGQTVELEYDFTNASQPLAGRELTPEKSRELVAWAPKARISAGTDSRAAPKPQGDWQHGRELFFGEQLGCSKCHRIRGEGGTAGPDLSNLVHRDSASILRDIREPSATLHPDYVTYNVTKKDGEVLQGFIRAQRENEIELFDAAGARMIIPRSETGSVGPTELSLMPQGLLDSLKENDVRDLLTWLLWEPPVHSVDSVRSLFKKTGDSSPVAEPLKIVLVASKQDHGPGQHDYPQWQKDWAQEIGKPGTGVRPELAWLWPSPEQFRDARVLVFYFWNHDWSKERLDQLEAFLQAGGGAVFIHSAVIADSAPEHLGKILGIIANPPHTGYRHMPFQLHFSDRANPITRGLPEFIDLIDEPYWPLAGSPADVHILAAADVDGAARPLIWTREIGKGRVFASIVGHYTRTLNDPMIHLLLLRAIEWTAHQDLPLLERSVLGEGNSAPEKTAKASAGGRERARIRASARK